MPPPTKPTGELIKLPTYELLQRFGSGGHKPGSGSAAALLSLVACKLLQTVVSLSSGRAEYQGVKDQLTLANQNIVQDIEPELLRALQEDSLQFHKVIEARRKREAEEDPQKRKALAEEALKELRLATEIPLQIAVLSISLAEKALTVFDLGFKSARGDSGVAISAALSGASGAISIVYLNLSYFKGGEWAVNTRNRADELTGKTSALQGELFRRLEQLRQTVIDKEPKSSS